MTKAGEADREEELSGPDTTRSGAGLVLLPLLSLGLTSVKTRACSCSPSRSLCLRTPSRLPSRRPDLSKLDLEKGLPKLSRDRLNRL